MKLKIFAISILLASGIFLLPTPPSRADGLISGYLLTKAKDYFEEGKYRLAIHEFSKVLLVDPDCQEAKDYLMRMGINGGIYGRQHPPLEQIAELGGEIVYYQDKVFAMAQETANKDALVKRLEDEKQFAEQAAAAKAKEAEDILKQADAARAEAEARLAESQAWGEEIKAKDEFKDKEIVRLHTDMHQMKKSLLTAEEAAQESQAAKKELEKKIDSLDTRRTEDLVKYEKAQVSLEKQLEENRHKMTSQEIAMQEQLDDLHHEVVKKTIQVAYTRDRLILANYKVALFENLLAEKEQRLLETQEILNDMKVQLGYFEKKVRENELARRQAVGQKAVSADFLKKQDEQIAALKEKLVGTKQELQNLKKEAARVSSENNQELQKQLGAMSRQLEESKSQYADKSSEYELMQKRIAEMQDRLRIVEGMLQSRDEQLRNLEDQLTTDLLKMEGGQ